MHACLRFERIVSFLTDPPKRLTGQAAAGLALLAGDRRAQLHRSAVAQDCHLGDLTRAQEANRVMQRGGTGNRLAPAPDAHTPGPKAGLRRRRAGIDRGDKGAGLVVAQVQRRRELWREILDADAEMAVLDGAAALDLLDDLAHEVARDGEADADIAARRADD